MILLVKSDLKIYFYFNLNIFLFLPILLNFKNFFGAPTIGGGSAQSRGGGGGGHRSQISLQSRPKCTTTAKKRAVSRMFGL